MRRVGSVGMTASARHGALYIGITSRIEARIADHRHRMLGGFPHRYGIKRLVWMECHQEITSAILREKQIKQWLREWKINLIEASNPDWDDLALSLFGFDPLATPIPEASTSLPRLRGNDESE